MSQTQTYDQSGIEDELGDEYEDVVDMAPPDIKGGRFGFLGDVWRIRRYRKKKRKLLSKGYVQWYLVDDGFPEPKWVKPKFEGGGVREYKYKGERYLFPSDAMVPDKKGGVWTVVHKRGDALPINLRDPSKHSIPTDELQEYTTLRATSSPPSFLGQFDLEADDLLKYGIIAIIGFAVLQGFLGGGLF